MKLPKLEFFNYHYNQDKEKDSSFDLNFIQNHPCFQALNEQEKDIYLCYRMGWKNYETAEKLGLRPDQVCRKIQEIKARFGYLLRFREILKTNKKARKKFFAAFFHEARLSLRRFVKNEI